MIITKIKESVNLAQQTQFSIMLEIDAFHAHLTKKLRPTVMERRFAENQHAELDGIPILRAVNLGAETI